MAEWLADCLLLLHAAFVLAVVSLLPLVLYGHRRGWHWVGDRRIRLAHLGALLFVVLESWLGIACPLTVWENHLRRGLGEAEYDRGFIADAVADWLYYDWPGWVFTLIYTAFALLVGLSFRLAPLRRQTP